MASDSDGNGIRDNADAFCNDPNWMTDSDNKDKDVSVMRKALSPFDTNKFPGDANEKR